jgi:hypothetical protein
VTRPLRINLEGGIHHVGGRGNERQAIFRDDEDRQERKPGARWSTPV